MTTDKYFRSESGRTAKVIKNNSSWLVVFFDKEQLVSNLRAEYPTLKQAKRDVTSWLQCGLI